MGDGVAYVPQIAANRCGCLPVIHNEETSSQVACEDRGSIQGRMAGVRVGR